MLMTDSSCDDGSEFLVLIFILQLVRPSKLKIDSTTHGCFNLTFVMTEGFRFAFLPFIVKSLVAEFKPYTGI